MTQLTNSQLNEWASQIARMIDGGESKTFCHSYGEYEVEVSYTCTIGTDKGDFWTAPSWWVESERVEVLDLYNIEDGESLTDLMAQLEQKLN